jgi:hypothetical protein
MSARFLHGVGFARPVIRARNAGWQGKEPVGRTWRPPLWSARRTIMTVELVNKYLEGTFYVVSLFAFLAGLYTYVQSNNEKRSQDVYAKYGELKSRYLRFLELSMEMPEIGFGESSQIEQKLTPEQEYKQRQLYYMFCNIAEEAYLFRKSMRPSEWKGWDLYIQRHCDMPILQKLWFDSSSPAQHWTEELSEDFVGYMEGIFHKKRAIQPNARLR